MKETTRDNLIYLAVGLGIAALVVADFIYAETHDRRMWVPSTFSFRLVSGTLLLAYFVVREMRRIKATPLQTAASLIFGGVLQVAVGFFFRQAFEKLRGPSFWAFGTLEMFVVWLLALQVARFMKSEPRT